MSQIKCNLQSLQIFKAYAALWSSECIIMHKNFLKTFEGRTEPPAERVLVGLVSNVLLRQKICICLLQK